ncbi:MAG TPA: biopolymer transporter ExbD [Chthoniobacterales bacterium]|nr:biopolymer transporter ExbD [Chthoniobacterales bacterium]
MNLRSRATPVHPGIQLAPLVDVLLLLLIFFLLTFNAARSENELDVKVPKASAAKEKTAPIGDVVVNVKTDGNVVVNRRTLTSEELTELLKGLVQLNAEQAVVIRGDETGAYRNIVNVLNICTQAGVTNVAFATAK